MTFRISQRLIVTALVAALASLGGWTSTALAQEPLACSDPVQITDNGINDVWPDWEAGGERITFNTYSTGGNVPRDIGIVNADGTGYMIAADVVGAPWGTFFPRWASGLPGDIITTAEHNVFHELMTFDVTKAPFARVVADGNDLAFTRKLLISGGGGGGWFVVSDDGVEAFWRWSTSGGGGTQQIRRGPVASLVGQPASITGTVIQQVSSGNQYWVEPIALSPDGTLYINAERTGATSNTNLVLRQTSNGALVRTIRGDAATGIASRGPDFNFDGTKIAYAYATGGQWDLYVENLDGTGVVNITNTPGQNELYPTWGPNGQRLAFNMSDGNDNEIHLCAFNFDPALTCTQGYWKNHPQSWVTLTPGDTPAWGGGSTYINILKRAPKKGDASIMLAHAYIAAKLNTGAPNDLLVDAEAMLTAHPVGTRDLESKGKNSHPDRALAIAAADALQLFNESMECPLS